MKKILSLFFVVGCLAFLPFSVKAAERITDFNSNIIVGNDGVITVNEKIKAIVEHDKINHGIYRDLITDYNGQSNDNFYRARYEIVSVKRNGVSEPFHLEQVGSNLRIYVGDEKELVPLGEAEYELVYDAYGLMRYFEKSDELYWNVTGNNWEFPIDNVTAVVDLPWGAGDYPDFYSYIDLYTGTAGAKGKDGEYKIENNQIVYTATRPFNSGEGMTIVLGFPKGRIAELLPEKIEYSATTKFLNSLSRQERQGILGFLSLMVFLYFSIVWFFKGRDLRKGTIIAQYEAPAGLSPADVAHIISLGGGFNKSLGSAVINLAIKGKIKITKKEEFLSIKKWQLDRLNKEVNGLTEEEKILMDSFFKNGEWLVIPNYDSELSSAINGSFRSVLNKKWNKVAYVTNFIWLFSGMFLSALLVVAYFFLDFENAFMAMFIVFAAVLFVVFFVSAILSVKKSLAEKSNTLIFIFFVIPSIFAAIFAGVFVWAFANVFFDISNINWVSNFNDHWHFLLLFLAMVVGALALKFGNRPTIEGRRLMDEIEGFKLFLVTTEKDRMDFFHPIEQVPEVFEKYFPYAIALGVADKWVARFNNLFQETNGQTAYAPLWYGGGLAGLSNISSISSIGTSLGTSLSSSGANGGGSSGGGGGGGGGGGW